MEGYFYHGFEFYPVQVHHSMEKMISILEKGILTRNESRNYQDTNFDYVCLYKKNPDYDYTKENATIHSARGGWIDNGYVFIIDSHLEAVKTNSEESNLVDEWRYYDSIDPSSFVGIALPFEAIQEYINSKDYSQEDRIDKEFVQKELLIILDKAKAMNLKIIDSGKEGFTDEFDQTIINEEKKSIKR